METTLLSQMRIFLKKNLTLIRYTGQQPRRTG